MISPTFFSRLFEDLIFHCAMQMNFRTNTFVALHYWNDKRAEWKVLLVQNERRGYVNWALTLEQQTDRPNTRTICKRQNIAYDKLFCKICGSAWSHRNVLEAPMNKSYKHSTSFVLDNWLRLYWRLCWNILFERNYVNLLFISLHDGRLWPSASRQQKMETKKKCERTQNWRRKTKVISRKYFNEIRQSGS